MALFYAYKSRGITRDITIRNAAGEAIQVGSTDKLRAIIQHQGRAAALLTVTTDAVTGNGSSFTKQSPTSTQNRLRLDATDLAFSAGTYTIVIDYFDAADASEWKTVSRQVFVLEE